MAQCNPVPLCSHLMPSGKLCRGVALRGHRYCRSHIRNYRQLDRERAQFAAIEQFAAKIQRMDFHSVLGELSFRLTQLSRTHNLTRFPEITYLLAYSIDRIEELNAAPEPLFPEALAPSPQFQSNSGNALTAPETNSELKLTADQIPEDLSGFSFNELNQMIEGLTNSINCRISNS